MRRILVPVLFTALAAGGLGVLAPAAGAAPAYLQKVTPNAGWETGPFRNLAAIGERFSSAAVGDLDGNGVPDVVAGFPDGHVRGWRSDNGALWFDHYTGAGAVQASPLLKDYNGDGRLDVVFANTHGDIGVVTSSGATIFYAHIGDGGMNNGAFATPAVTDLNHDGRPDIVVSGFDQRLHAWGPGTNPPELPGFPILLGDTSWSSPAIGDLNGDGWDDIVVGYDCDGAPGQRCAPNYGGYLGAFDHNGRELPGWPRFVEHQVVWSTPALADLDGDGRLDVVVGTGNMNATMFDRGLQRMAGTQVFAWRGDGSNVPGWPVTVGRNVTSSPAVGDINGDGRPDVAFVAEDGFLYGYSGSGVRLFSRCAGNDVDLPRNDGTVTYGQECPILHASPTIADVMGTGRQQVLVGGEQWMHVFDSNGNVVAQGETYAGTDPMTATPTVANVGGRATIYEATTSGTDGLHARVLGWTTGKALGKADWPTFKNNSSRNGHGVLAPVHYDVGGAIGDKYAALGGAKGLLGAPTSNEYAVRGGRGQNFAGGAMYWSFPTGAHEVHGAVLQHFAAMGGANSALGLPLTDETSLAGGTGRGSTFQGGSVMWSAGTGAWTVWGLILDHYKALGGPGGTLGFPTSDEYAVPGGRASSFRGGVVYWSGSTGAKAVQGNLLLRYKQMGGPGSFLGMPITDELAVTGGRASYFQGGRMYWSDATGPRVVNGSILSDYLARGGPTSRLKLPTSDEYAVPGGRRSDFQGGWLRWDATTFAITAGP